METTNPTTAIVPAVGAKADRARQMQQVVTWILDGGSEVEIRDAIATTWPDAKAHPLMAQAMAQILKNGDGDAETFRLWAIEATRHQYQKATEAGDTASALKAIRQIVELTEAAE